MTDTTTEGRGTFTRELRTGSALRVAALAHLTDPRRAPGSHVMVVPIALGGQQFWSVPTMVREGAWTSDTDYNRLLNGQVPADQRWPYRPRGFEEYRMRQVGAGDIGYFVLHNNGVGVDLDELDERAALLERGAEDSQRLRAMVVDWHRQAGLPLVELAAEPAPALVPVAEPVVSARDVA